MLDGLGAGVSRWVALAVAALMSGFFIRARLNFLAIPKLLAPASDDKLPDCMVVIPARNEESAIARAVMSFPHDTVIVVDDHSEDGTAEAARKAGAGVLPAPELARGAIGKSAACLAGARVLTSRWVLFADADTWYEPRFLNALISFAEASGVDFLSLYLQPECETWPERMLVPYAVALYFCGTGPRRNPAVLFNGQCLLVRREAYEFVGGHSPVMNNLVDDVKLAALAQRHRLKVALARAPHLGHARMQKGLRGIWRGFERNAFRFVVVSPWIGALIIAAALSMALWLPALAWLVKERQYVAAAGFALLPMALLCSWYGNWARVLLAPFAIYCMLPVLWHGMTAALLGRRIEWKGRTI